MKNENNAVPAGPIAYAVYGIDAAGKHYLRAVKPIEAGEDWKIDDDCLGDRWSGNEALSAVAPSDLQGLADALKFKRDCPKCGHVFADPECTRAADVLERLSASEPSDATGKAAEREKFDAANAGGLDDERAAFEAWGNELFNYGFEPGKRVNALDDAEYEHEGTQMAWEGWKARAAMSQSRATSAANAGETDAHIWAAFGKRYAQSTKDSGHYIMYRSGWTDAATSAADAKDAELSESELMKIARKWARGREETRGINDFLFTRGKFFKMIDEVRAAIASTKQAAPVAKGEQVTVACKYEVYPAGTSPRTCARCGKGPCTQQAQSSAKGGDAVGGENV